MNDETVLRRKIGARPESAARPAMTPARVWRRAAVHGLARSIGMEVTVRRTELHPVGAEEAADLAGDHSLCLLLDGPAAYGLVVLDTDLTAAIVERQTIGHVARRSPAPRAPTGLDAAMVADPLDHVLAAQETLAAELPAGSMTAGYRFATRIEERREIGLSLADVPHSLAEISLDLAEGRCGTLRVVLPATPPAPPSVEDEGARSAADPWAERIEARLMGSEIVLSAELARTRMTIEAVTRLSAGDVVALPRSAIGAVELRTGGGARLAGGRLGQSAGRKAIRLEAPAAGPDLFEAPQLPTQGVDEA